MKEFDLIREIFRSASYAQPNEQVAQSIGDDCALLNLPSATQLAISVDSLIEGVHFPANCAPFLLGQRALAVAVSDLAATGATPIAFTLALSLPQPNVEWLRELSVGLASMAARCAIRLAGGDTTAGPLNIGITVLGHVPSGQALKRSGAQVGDGVFVSGALGAAAAALRLFSAQPPLLSTETVQALEQAYWAPQPQLELGRWLLGKATSALDISDGLLADAGHIAQESNVLLTLEQSKIPIASAAQGCDPLHALNWALSGGDDYQLLFTMPLELQPALQALFPAAQCIGVVREGCGVQLLDEHFKPVNYSRAGYQHFG